MSESVRVIPPFIETPPALARSLALRPTATEWVRHSLLFLITVVTTTFAGIVQAAPNLEADVPEPSTIVGWVLFIPEFYLQTVSNLISFAILNPRILAEGLTFSVALLAILLAHEMGHYVACRRYGVSATLPFFIPAPPLFFAGTFGAFIKIRSPIPTRRALFDIGLAGTPGGLHRIAADCGDRGFEYGTAAGCDRPRDYLQRSTTVAPVEPRTRRAARAVFAD